MTIVQIALLFIGCMACSCLITIRMNLRFLDKLQETEDAFMKELADFTIEQIQKAARR